MINTKVTGTGRVYKNEGQNGSSYFVTSIGQKNMDGTYSNGRVYVRFKKGTEPDIAVGQFAEIEFVNAWWKFVKDEEAKKIKSWYIFVSEYGGDALVTDNGAAFSAVEDDMPF